MELNDKFENSLKINNQGPRLKDLEVFNNVQDYFDKDQRNSLLFFHLEDKSIN